ncbi:flagellin [Selenomonas sp. oral taxon 149]|uniref:flagellin N-terminal helical domain-containing protein n=1 Tax=Selenomonas sp. oral taxon 149 TaxID=712535 RepID=UPI0001E0EAAF|nr:flagellin [Selenomonas sp. oral taxon 149]EFM22521.1 bacterial flagellin domain protein [Selenomonas sp. oral taxon 149 str. 67H29BP]
MAMVVKNNMSAVNTLNILNRNQSALAKSLQKVSSGMKINDAGDDASGYAISERMRVQIRSLDQDKQNTQNGNSMMKTAEGAVASTVEILKTLKEKAINAANDTNTDEDRRTIQKEINQMVDQIDDNALATYNGKYLVDGSRNSIGTATCTTLTNSALSTAADWGSALTALQSRQNEGLNIQSTDNVTVSYVRQGKTYTTTFSVGTNTLSSIITKTAYNGTDSVKGTDLVGGTTAGAWIGLDKSGNSVYTADNKTALSINSAGAGTSYQISAFTIGITDNTGALRKTANTRLDAFNERIRSENKSEDNALVLQTGVRANQAIKVSMTDMRSLALGMKGMDGAVISVQTQDKANAAINSIDSALQKALDEQANIGAVQTRLRYTASNLTTASENVQNSESTIRDADMAKEMTEYTKNNVLLQAAQSMLAQANQNSSAVLSLLR